MKRILLVEDDETLVALMSEVLEREGHHVTVARAAEEAIRYTDIGERFDLLVTDLVLPGTGRGYHVTWHLTAVNPSLPVLVISGYASESDQIADAVWSPRTAFLEKPFDLRIFRYAVQSLLD